jgi:2'-5' RNA ligase
MPEQADMTERFDMSALILPMRTLDPVVAPYRRRHTTDGAAGVPAHLTVLYPFCAHVDWGLGLSARIAAAVSGVLPFSLTFHRLGRFPGGITYLEPEPMDLLMRLIRSVADSFPEYPPYGGTVSVEAFHPHVTIAVATDSDELARVEEDFLDTVGPSMPLREIVEALWMMVRTQSGWKRHSAYALGPGDRSTSSTG